MSVIFATQLTAIATVALAVLALAAATVASLVLYEQSRELAILAAQNERDIAERHQAQAARVYTFGADPGAGYPHPGRRTAATSPSTTPSSAGRPRRTMGPRGYRPDPAGRPRHRQPADPLSRCLPRDSVLAALRPSPAAQELPQAAEAQPPADLVDPGTQ